MSSSVDVNFDYYRKNGSKENEAGFIQQVENSKQQHRCMIVMKLKLAYVLICTQPRVSLADFFIQENFICNNKYDDDDDDNYNGNDDNNLHDEVQKQGSVSAAAAAARQKYTSLTMLEASSDDSHMETAALAAAEIVGILDHMVQRIIVY